MVRTPCCDKNGLKKGPWTQEEDRKLIAYVTKYGHWNWRLLPKFAGLARCGKSCRLRWLNYLRPDVKRGNFSNEEEETIVTLHEKLGNRWSAIAAQLPGRTDNEIKNHWHTSLKKRFEQKTDAKRGTGKEVNASKSMKRVSENYSDPDTYPLSPQPCPSSYTQFSCITANAASTRNHQNSVIDTDDALSFLDEYIDPVCSNFWTEPYLTDNYVPPECESEYFSHLYDAVELWTQNDLWLQQCDPFY